MKQFFSQDRTQITVAMAVGRERLGDHPVCIKFFNVQEPMIPLSFPKLYNLRTDPFETADFNSNSYDQWAFDRTFVGAIAQATARDFFRSLLEFPPQQAASSFNPDIIMQRIQSNNN